MEQDKVLSYLKNKREAISSLREMSTDSPEFKQWYQGLETITTRLGKQYHERFNNLTFWVMVSFGYDDTADDRRAYLDGLDDADAMLHSMIEDIELWGSPVEPSRPAAVKRPKDNMTFNITISQQQTQNLVNEINLEQYEPEIQQHVRELLDELQKKNKNKAKITSLLKWLADKGADALIALIAANH